MRRDLPGGPPLEVRITNGVLLKGKKTPDIDISHLFKKRKMTLDFTGARPPEDEKKKQFDSRARRR